MHLDAVSSGIWTFKGGLWSPNKHGVEEQKVGERAGCCCCMLAVEMLNLEDVSHHLCRTYRVWTLFLPYQETSMKCRKLLVSAVKTHTVHLSSHVSYLCAKTLEETPGNPYGWSSPLKISLKFLCILRMLFVWLLCLTAGGLSRSQHVLGRR